MATAADPFGALLQLLERETASHFKDEFLDVPLDTSAILWVATANSPERIPDHILSRMAVYEVPAPTPEHARAIALSIYKSLLAEGGWSFDAALAEDVLAQLERVAPREMRKRILDGLARAVRQRRDTLVAADINCSHSKQARPMGFLV